MLNPLSWSQSRLRMFVALMAMSAMALTTTLVDLVMTGAA